ncbi:MAG: SDR family oxidoreductase [Chloroflexota bacterium]
MADPRPGDSLFDLTGKVAIVTGGGQGIGRSLVHGLAAHRASVVIADVAGAAAGHVAEEVEATGGTALPVPTDVTRPEEVDRLVELTVRHFGTLDILVNNAGGGRKAGGATESLSFESWLDTFDLTVNSAFLCAQRAGRVMIRQRSGKIINVASVYGLLGHNPALYAPRSNGEPAESIAYAAAKGAVVNFTRALAVYWARYHINVNAVAPGMVQTERLATSVDAETWERLAERTPLRRPATPDDLRGAVIYLASAAADFVTGQILVVDGGWTAW